MKKTKISKVVISVAFLSLISSGLCLAADQALIKAAKKEGAVVWYTAFPRRFIPPIGDLFKKKYNLGDSFKVRATRKGSGATTQSVEAEHMTGKSNWDVVSMGDAAPSLRWIDKGMLMKYQPPNVGNIRKEFQDPYGYRVGGQIWITSIAVHRGRVPEKDWPKSYKDALDPKWKGRVAMANPTTSGPGVVITRFLIDLYGWEYFRDLGKNKPVLVKGGSALEQLLLSGEVDLALGPNEFSIAERIKANEFSIAGRIKGGEAGLKLLYPEEGTSYSVMWLCINKDAPHPNAAKLWMEFTASDEREEFVTKNAGRYITSKNVKLGIPRPPLKFHNLDWQWLKVHKDEMSKRFIEEIRKGR